MFSFGSDLYDKQIVVRFLAVSMGMECVYYICSYYITKRMVGFDILEPFVRYSSCFSKMQAFVILTIYVSFIPLFWVE